MNNTTLHLTFDKTEDRTTAINVIDSNTPCAWVIQPNCLSVTGTIEQLDDVANRLTKRGIAFQQHNIIPEDGATLPNLFHQSDPNAPEDYHCWHYVYIHGQAELFNGQQVAHVEDRTADDLFVADKPMPPIGEHRAMLYGKEVVVVIAKRFPNVIGGRIAFPDDTEAVAHCRKPDDWR